MKITYMTLIMIILSIVLLLAGCSHNKTAAPQQDGIKLKMGSTTSYPNLSIPAWVLYPSEGTSAVGIAMDSNNKENSASDEAYAFALKTLTLLNCDFKYNPETLVKLSLATDAKPDYSQLQVELVPNPESPALKQIELKPLVEAKLEGYRLVLAGNAENKVNNDPFTVSAALTPEWCRGDVKFNEPDFLYAVGEAENADLAGAWDEALRRALIGLFNARLPQIGEQIRNNPSIEEQIKMAETAMLKLNPTFSRNWLFYKTVDDKGTYTVFIQLRGLR